MGMGFDVNKNVYEVMPDLVKNLNLNTTKQLECEWLGEAFINRVEGKHFKGTMNLSAFSASCEKYTALNRAKNGEVALLDSGETMNGYNGVTADFIVDTNALEEFMKVEESADMKYYVENFVDMWDYIKHEVGKELWVLLNLSMQDDKKAHLKLRALIQEFDRLDEIITYVIKNPCRFTALAEIFQYTIEMAS